MKWQPRNLNDWRRVFALLPVRTNDGVMVWLEYVERRDTYIGSSWFEDHYKTEFRPTT